MNGRGDVHLTIAIVSVSYGSAFMTILKTTLFIEHTYYQNNSIPTLPISVKNNNIM